MVGVLGISFVAAISGTKLTLASPCVGPSTLQLLEDACILSTCMMHVTPILSECNARKTSTERGIPAKISLHRGPRASGPKPTRRHPPFTCNPARECAGTWGASWKAAENPPHVAIWPRSRSIPYQKLGSRFRANEYTLAPGPSMEGPSGCPSASP
jgi:hypothetical protein